MLKKKKVTLEVTGMSCGHCEQTVRDTLASIPGVAKVIKVDKDSNSAEIKVEDPNKIPSAEILKALEEAGYPASLGS